MRLAGGTQARDVSVGLLKKQLGHARRDGQFQKVDPQLCEKHVVLIRVITSTHRVDAAGRSSVVFRNGFGTALKPFAQ
jgi:hypothetical protein